MNLLSWKMLAIVGLVLAGIGTTVALGPAKFWKTEPAVRYSITGSLHWDQIKRINNYWFDPMTRMPNLFAVIQIEGVPGEVLLPELKAKYQGETFMWSLVGDRLPTGRKILVTFYDDCRLEDALWRGLMGAAVTIRGDAHGGVALAGISAGVRVGGDIVIKADLGEIVIVKPMLIGQFEVAASDQPLTVVEAEVRNPGVAAPIGKIVFREVSHRP